VIVSARIPVENSPDNTGIRSFWVPPNISTTLLSRVVDRIIPGRVFPDAEETLSERKTRPRPILLTN